MSCYTFKSLPGPRETSTPERCPKCGKRTTLWSRTSSDCFACETRAIQKHRGDRWFLKGHGGKPASTEPTIEGPELYAAIETVAGRVIVRGTGTLGEVQDYIKTVARSRQSSLFTIRRLHWSLGPVVELHENGEPVGMDERLGDLLDLRPDQYSDDLGGDCLDLQPDTED